MPANKILCTCTALFCLMVLGAGCGHYLLPGPFHPFEAAQQETTLDNGHMEVFDDGTVSFGLDRLEVSVRPMTDEELNRRYDSFSNDGGGPADELPTNAFTYGEWEGDSTAPPPQRFSIFLVSIKNYQYPKVMFDPLEATIHSGNGRVYYPWGPFDFEEFFRRFPQAFNGLGYRRFSERRDMIRRAQYPEDEFCFSGQEVQGYIIFPRLHDDVEEITFRIPRLGLRYDYRNEAMESVDLAFRFKRELRKVSSYDEVTGLF